MSTLFVRRPSALRRADRVLDMLEAQLGNLYQAAVNTLAGNSHNPGRVSALSPLLHRLTELMRFVQITRRELQLENIETARKQLEEWIREFARNLEVEENPDPQLQRILTQAIHLFIKAEEAIRLSEQAQGRKDAAPQSLEILIQSDILFQCFQSLFPPERMLAVSGRRKNRQIELGAVFDVTGNASAGHVQADPRKLGQALLAMNFTDTHLAAWFHSHPGTGLPNTCPSGIDLRQHADWLRDYSSRLLSGIFVQNRYLRFWGTALDKGEIQVRIVGPGVTAVKGDNHVYQFVTS
jgi:hypothetical protein